MMNAISCVSAQIPLYADDAEHLEALLRAGEGVLSGFDLQNQSPMTVLTFCTNASSACLQAGDEDRAASYLERFTSLLEELDARTLVYGRNQSALYDRAPELGASIPARSISRKPGSARSTFRRQCAQMVAAQPRLGRTCRRFAFQAAVRPTGGPMSEADVLYVEDLAYRYGKTEVFAGASLSLRAARSRFSPGRAVLTIVLTLLSLLWLVPLAFILINSFKGKLFISESPFALPNGESSVGLNNYTKTLGDDNFGQAIMCRCSSRWPLWP